MLRLTGLILGLSVAVVVLVLDYHDGELVLGLAAIDGQEQRASILLVFIAISFFEPEDAPGDQDAP